MRLNYILNENYSNQITFKKNNVKTVNTKKVVR